METIKLVKKDCGKHWGAEPGPCSKCAYFRELESSPKYAKYRKGLQYNGTPWIAVLGPPVPKPDWID